MKRKREEYEPPISSICFLFDTTFSFFYCAIEGRKKEKENVSKKEQK